MVVGAGQAGAALVAKLRALGHGGPLTLVGAEPLAALPAPAALQGLPQGRARPRAAVPAPAELLRPPKASTSSPAPPSPRSTAPAGAVVLADGRAPALRPPRAHHRRPAPTPARRAGGDLAGVLLMRAPRRRRRARRRGRAPGARALIVGGGYIGLEAAAVLREKGLEVMLVEAAPRILARVAAPATADYFRDPPPRPRRRPSARRPASTRLTGAGGRVPAPTLADGPELAADLVLVGIGIEPGHRARRRGRARDRQRHRAPTRRAAPRTRRSSPPATARASRCARAAGCGSRACRTPSTRPRRWPRRCSATPSRLRRAAVVLVRPVRRQAADRRPQRRLGPHARPVRARGRAASRSGTGRATGCSRSTR